MGKFWRALTGFVRRLLGSSAPMMEHLVDLALPIVARLAEASRAESDDLLVELAHSYRHPEVLRPGRTRNDILRALAVAVLRDVSGLQLRSRWFEAAIALALVRRQVEEEGEPAAEPGGSLPKAG